MAVEKAVDFPPAVVGLFHAIGGTLGCEKSMPCAVITMEFVGLAELFQDLLGPVDLIGAWPLVFCAEYAEHGSGHVRRQINRRDRPRRRQLLRIVDDDAAAPAIHDGVKARQRTAGQPGMAAARTEAHDRDLGIGFRLGAQKGHAAGHIADELVVGHTAAGAHARADIVGRAGAVAKIQMRSDAGEAGVCELAGGLDDPVVPAGQMVDEDDATEFLVA